MRRPADTTRAALLALWIGGCSLLTPLDDLTSGGAGDGAPPSSDAAPQRDAEVDAPTDDASATSDAAPVDGGAGDAGTTSDATSDATALSVYRSIVLFDSPLGYWRLGESSTSALARDEASAHRDGAYVGFVLLGAAGALVGDPDPAATFDGTTATVQLTNDFDFPVTQPFSLEAWIRPTTRDATYRHVISRETSDGNGRQGYAIFVHQNAGLGFERFVNGANVIASAPFPPLGAYTHVVATYDGAALRLYVNGVLANGASDTRAAAPQNARAYVGSQSASGSFFQGSIDEPAIYGQALTPAMVQTHYHAGIRQ